MGMAVIARFSSSSSKRSPAAVAHERDAVRQGILGRVGGLVAARQADDVRHPGRDREHPVAVARDQDRHVGRVLAHVLGHVLQVVDPLTRRRIGQLGRLELLADVPRAKAEFEAPLGQVTQRGDVTGQQCGLVEARVEDEGAESQSAGRRGRHRQRGERRRRTQMVGNMQHVEAELLRLARGILDLRPRPRVVQAHTEPELIGHPQIVFTRRCLGDARTGQPPPADPDAGSTTTRTCMPRSGPS